MFVTQSRLSKIFALALLSATLIATVPTQAGVYTDKAKNIGKITLKTGLTLTKVAVLSYCLNECRRYSHDIPAMIENSWGSLYKIRDVVNIAVLNLALATVTAKSLYNDAQTFMENRAAKKEAAQ